MTLSRTIKSSKDLNSNKRLSVQVSLTGLSFLLETTGEASIYKSVAFDSQLNPAQVLQEILAAYQGESFLNSAVSEVRIIFHNKEFALVPTKLFDPSNLSEYLKYNAHLLSNDFLDYDTIEAFELSNVYVPYTNVNNFVFDRYGDFSFEHSVTVYLKATAHLNEPNDQATVYIEKQENDFILVAFKENVLQIANVFPQTCKEDLLYYLLFALEQIQLDPETIQLNITGGIAANDPYYDLIYTYIRHVTILNPDAQKDSFLVKNCWL